MFYFILNLLRYIYLQIDFQLNKKKYFLIDFIDVFSHIVSDNYILLNELLFKQQIYTKLTIPELLELIQYHKQHKLYISNNDTLYQENYINSRKDHITKYIDETLNHYQQKYKYTYTFGELRY